MILLLTVREKVTLVWGSDPSVGLDRDEWLAESDVGRVVAGDALRLTVRALDPREMAAVLDTEGGLSQQVKALEIGYVEARGPGVPTERDALIAALPVRCRQAAGAHIIMLSIGPPTLPASSPSQRGVGSTASGAATDATSPGEFEVWTTPPAPGA